MSVIKQISKCVKKYKKGIIYGAFAFLCGQVFLFNFGRIGIQNQVFAADDTKTQSEAFAEKASKQAEIFGTFEKIMYVALWPLLFLAGKLVDNSMIYGSVFGFDAILWNLWNMVKNLANFGLGFIFLYKVFELLIKGKQSDIKKILVSSLIAGVGIQASWFIMAALIDVSTIAAYGIGGLPISVLGSDNSNNKNSTGYLYNPYVPGMSMYVDSNDTDTINTYIIGNSGVYISECMTFSYKDKNNTGNKSEELIIAPKMIYYFDEQGGGAKKTESDKCHHYGQVYYFGGQILVGWETFEGTGWKESQQRYLAGGKQVILEYQEKDVSEVSQAIRNGNILQIGDAHATGGIAGEVFSGIQYSDKIGLDVGNEWLGAGGGLSRLSELLSSEKNGGTYLGVFSTLYTSLLNAGINLKVGHQSDGDIGVWEGLLNVFLSFGHTVAIFIPLAALVLVLGMRIFILWMAIALSPVIILLKAFGFDKKLFKDGMLKHLQISNLIGIIFSPFLVCFAVSLSTVLVRKIMDMNIQAINTEVTTILGGLITLNIGGFTVGLGQLIVSAIAVVITWVLMWRAVKANSLGQEKWVGKLETLATNALGSVPIVPVLAKDKEGNLKLDTVGTKVAFGGNGEGGIVSKLSDKFINEFNDDNQKAINTLFNNETSAAPEELNYNAYSNKILSASIVDGTPWTQQIVKIGEHSNMDFSFNNLSAANKEHMINKINDLTKEEDRDKFGENESEISFVGDDNKEIKYKFDRISHQYKKQTS